jgi:aminopeptidase
MADPRMQKLADILVNYSTKVKPGDWVMVWSNTVALPLAREVYRCVLRAGGHPTLRLDDDDLNEVFMAEASEEQLQWMSPVTSVSVSQVNAMIRLNAAHNTRVLMGIDPTRSRTYQAARRELMEIYLERAAKKDLRWVTTQFPCQAHAQEADMSLHEYEDFIYQATFADQPDPVARWLAVHDKQQHWVDWLKGKREVRVQGPNVGLTLSIAERSFINSDGENNMPSGEIYTSPVEDSAAGWIRFSYPAVRQGRAVEDVSLEFKAGKVVVADAEKNAEYLNTMLDIDEGARFLGEFAIGTNYAIQRFTKNMLFDEKIGGTIHLALGSGFPEAGGVNKSTLHWDMVCDMRTDSTIHVDGELFYKDGQFQV